MPEDPNDCKKNHVQGLRYFVTACTWFLLLVCQIVNAG